MRPVEGSRSHVCDGGHSGFRERLDEHVEVLQKLGRPTERRQRANGAAQLAHRLRSVEPVPHDVAHDERVPATREVEDLVPVTADLERCGAGQVGPCEPCPFDRGRIATEKAELQRVRDAALLFVQDSVVECERCACAEAEREHPRQPRIARGEAQDAERPSARAKWRAHESDTV